MLSKEYMRGRLDILANIVRLCEEETKKTRITFSANLSYMQVNHYLEDLQAAGLIETITRDNDALFRATTKGRDFLIAYERMIQIRDPPTITSEVAY